MPKIRKKINELLYILKYSNKVKTLVGNNSVYICYIIVFFCTLNYIYVK